MYLEYKFLKHPHATRQIIVLPHHPRLWFGVGLSGQHNGSHRRLDIHLGTDMWLGRLPTNLLLRFEQFFLTMELFLTTDMCPISRNKYHGKKETPRDFYLLYIHLHIPFVRGQTITYLTTLKLFGGVKHSATQAPKIHGTVQDSMVVLSD